MKKKVSKRSKSQTTEPHIGPAAEGDNVVAITDAKPPRAVAGVRKNRVILSLGSQRIAFYFTTRITELPFANVIELPRKTAARVKKSALVEMTSRQGGPQSGGDAA
jgi:hypothetical protein